MVVFKKREGGKGGTYPFPYDYYYFAVRGHGNWSIAGLWIMPRSMLRVCLQVTAASPCCCFFPATCLDFSDASQAHEKSAIGNGCCTVSQEGGVTLFLGCMYI